jgi:hypothetical protein
MATRTNVEHVLRGMGEVYAAMTSYADTGEVNTTQLAPGKKPVQVRFSTLYQRPSLFRFEFLRPHPYPPLNQIVTQFVFGFDGTSAYQRKTKHSESATLTSLESLPVAIASATGISKGTAHTVARLLTPEMEGFSLLDLIEPRLNEQKHIDGITCYSIDAQHPNGSRYGLWIENDTFRLRKVIHATDRSCIEAIRNDIRVNQPIELRLFNRERSANLV